MIKRNGMKLMYLRIYSYIMNLFGVTITTCPFFHISLDSGYITFRSLLSSFATWQGRISQLLRSICLSLLFSFLYYLNWWRGCFHIDKGHNIILDTINYRPYKIKSDNRYYRQVFKFPKFRSNSSPPKCP
jgi:hypothetical protein